MLAALLFVAAAMALIGVLLLVVVVVGIRQEPVNTEMACRAPRPAAALTRCLLGVHVRRPAAPEDLSAYRGFYLAGLGSEGERR